MHGKGNAEVETWKRRPILPQRTTRQKSGTGTEGANRVGLGRSNRGEGKKGRRENGTAVTIVLNFGQNWSGGG